MWKKLSSALCFFSFLCCRESKLMCFVFMVSFIVWFFSVSANGAKCKSLEWLVFLFNTNRAHARCWCSHYVIFFDGDQMIQTNPNAWNGIVRILEKLYVVSMNKWFIKLAWMWWKTHIIECSVIWSWFRSYEQNSD